MEILRIPDPLHDLFSSVSCILVCHDVPNLPTTHTKTKPQQDRDFLFCVSCRHTGLCRGLGVIIGSNPFLSWCCVLGGVAISTIPTSSDLPTPAGIIRTIRFGLLIRHYLMLQLKVT